MSEQTITPPDAAALPPQAVSTAPPPQVVPAKTTEQLIADQVAAQEADNYKKQQAEAESLKMAESMAFMKYEYPLAIKTVKNPALVEILNNIGDHVKSPREQEIQCKKYIIKDAFSGLTDEEKSNLTSIERTRYEMYSNTSAYDVEMAWQDYKSLTERRENAEKYRLEKNLRDASSILESSDLAKLTPQKRAEAESIQAWQKKTNEDKAWLANARMNAGVR